jgi:hypothetical protein
MSKNSSCFENSFIISSSVPWLVERMSLCAVNNHYNWLWHNPYLEVPDTDDCPTDPLLPENLYDAIADAVDGGDEELQHKQAVAGVGE